MIEYLRGIRREFLVVGTKSDKLSNNTLGNSVLALKKAHGVDEVLPCSVKDQRNIKQLWARILAVRDRPMVD